MAQSNMQAIVHLYDAPLFSSTPPRVLSLGGNEPPFVTLSGQCLTLIARDPDALDRASDAMAEAARLLRLAQEDHARRQEHSQQPGRAASAALAMAKAAGVVAEPSQ